MTFAPGLSCHIDEKVGSCHFNLALATYMPLSDSFAFLFSRQTYWIQTFLSSAMQAATGGYVRDFWL